MKKQAWWIVGILMMLAFIVPASRTIKQLQIKSLTQRTQRAGLDTSDVKSDIPPQYAEAVEWLNSLRRYPEQTLHGPKGTPKWNVDKLTHAISKSGLVITVAIDPEHPVKLSYNEAESQIKNRQDPLAQIFFHVGGMYSLPSPQHSKLTFFPKSDGLEIHMGDNFYVFKYRMEEGHYKLSEINYLVVEGD